MFVYSFWVAHDDPLTSLCSYLEEHLPFIKVVAREEGGEKKEGKRRRKREREREGEGYIFNKLTRSSHTFRGGNKVLAQRHKHPPFFVFFYFFYKKHKYQRGRERG